MTGLSRVYDDDLLTDLWEGRLGGPLGRPTAHWPTAPAANQPTDPATYWPTDLSSSLAY